MPQLGRGIIARLHESARGFRACRSGTAGTGGRVKRCLILILALISTSASIYLTDRSIAQGETKPSSMQFEWRTEGPVAQCGRSCRTWASAVGLVTDR